MACSVSLRATIISHLVLALVYLGIALAPALGAQHDGDVHVDFFTSDNCSATTMNGTVTISATDNPLCTQCWDRCNADTSGTRSFRLRGGLPNTSVATNGNCIGKFAYLGGWSDRSLGGVVSVADGCHKGVPSAMVLCSGTVKGLQDDLDEVCGSPLPEPPEVTNKTLFMVLDPSNWQDELGTDYNWALGEIPFLEIDADPALTTAYYYRARVLRKHMKWTADGWILTEFLPYVPWSGRHNAIPAAAGHHIMESRWLHDPAVHQDYSRFWYDPRQMYASFGGTQGYTQWIGWATWNAYLVTGNTSHIEYVLPLLSEAYRTAYVKHYQAFVNGSMCWKQNDGQDAMEVSISGSGCRPTIASVMWGEAKAIVNMAIEVGNQSLVDEFNDWVNKCENIVTSLHWNPSTKSFATIPLGQSTATNYDPVPPGCNLSAIRKVNKTVDVRELLGFMPFYFPGLLPSATIDTYLPMWFELLDVSGFSGKYGLKTAEARSPCYNYSWSHGDCWNGPSWPYETARVLTAAANLLNEPASAKNSYITKDIYMELLIDYAKQHTVTSAINDTANPPGSGHIFENLHADKGYWNNRAIMYWNMQPTRNQGNNYFHSSFIDLVVSGVIGLRPSNSNSTITINPLVSTEAKYFCLDGVFLKGHWISIVWDSTGTKYRLQQGLHVFVDGKIAASSATLKSLTVNL